MRKLVQNCLKSLITGIENDNDKIPDSKCHVFEWEEHQGCEHDPMKQELDLCKEQLVRYRAEKRESIGSTRVSIKYLRIYINKHFNKNYLLNVKVINLTSY